MTEPYYQDDLVTLYHGDCLKITDWLTADVLVTDPPYGVGWKRGSGTNPLRSARGHGGVLNDQDTSARDRALLLWGSDRPGVVFGSWQAPFPPHKQVLVWQKPLNSGVVGSTTGYRRDVELIFLIGGWPKRPAGRSSVLFPVRGNQSYVRQGWHPHVKPVELMTSLLEWTDGAVADPFAGSGSTLVAARGLGRQAIGVELDERYCEVAAKRLQDLAVLV